MIGRLRGQVVERDAGVAIVEVGGVGYRVEMGARQLDSLSESEEVVLAISTQVREDDIRLFGFQEKLERDAFQTLLGVSGVGPKAAIALLGSLSLSDLTQAIEQENVSVIASAPGIGPKTARRVSLELKGKMPVAFEVPHSGPSATRTPPSDPLPLALAQLGYRKSEIDQALAGLSKRDLVDAPLQERLSVSLKILSGGA
jgi:Holliday junction DNA helicase RuvA